MDAHEAQAKFDQDYAQVEILRKEVESAYRTWCEKERQLNLAEQRLHRSFEARLDHIAQPPVTRSAKRALGEG